MGTLVFICPATGQEVSTRDRDGMGRPSSGFGANKCAARIVRNLIAYRASGAWTVGQEPMDILPGLVEALSKVPARAEFVVFGWRPFRTQDFPNASVARAFLLSRFSPLARAARPWRGDIPSPPRRTRPVSRANPCFPRHLTQQLSVDREVLAEASNEGVSLRLRTSLWHRVIAPGVNRSSSACRAA